MNGGTEGDSRRRSGRRSSEPLQHITLGGGPPSPRGDDESASETELDDRSLDAPPARTGRSKPKSKSAAKSKPKPGSAATPAGRSARTPPGYATAAAAVRTGLDRIKPRAGSASPGRAGGPAHRDLGPTAADRDPLGRAALYSSGTERHQPALGTFLLECSACRRETPVTAGDLIRLGVPSFHLPFVKRFPSLMRCPACGRRTWLRVHWRL